MARLLILGGTAEAAELSARLAGDDRLETVTSLAGLTRLPNVGAGRRAPRRLWRPGRARRLPQGRAATMRSSTRRILSPRRSPRMLRKRRRRPACRDVKLLRPPFERTPADRFIAVPDMEAAAAALPHGARVFLAAGRREVAPFAARADLWCLVRMIEPPAAGDPMPAGELILGRPALRPGSRDRAAQRSMTSAGSSRRIPAGRPAPRSSRPGGSAFRSCWSIGLAAPAGPTVATVGEVMAWIEARLLSPPLSARP